MDLEENDFLVNQFLHHFHDPQSQTKDYQLGEYRQMSECIEIIKKEGELEDKLKSLKYILSHINNLEIDDSIEIGPFILEYALDFANVELSVTSIHILSILIKNDQKNNYRLIEQEFIQTAIEKSGIIFSYCQGPLTPQICDLIFSFIKFSNETFYFSLDNQLIHAIINGINFAGGDLDQMIFHLKLILDITKLLNYRKKTTPKIYETNSEIYHKASQAMNLSIPQLYDILLKIYDGIFRAQPENSTNQKIYNNIYEPLFDDFFNNYAKFFSEDYNNKAFFLNILLNFSKTSFVINIIKKYPIYDFIIPYLLIKVDDIDENPNINIGIIKLSWEIAGNFIFEEPGQVNFVISNNISNNAIEICQEGTIEMKCSIIKFLSNILCCVYDQNIFKYVEETNLLERLLILVECLPIGYSGYIIMSVIDFIKSPKIPTEAKRILIFNANVVEVSNSLTNFCELCDDEFVNLECTKLLAYLDGECDEYLGEYDLDEEEEEEAETMQ